MSMDDDDNIYDDIDDEEIEDVVVEETPKKKKSISDIKKSVNDTNEKVQKLKNLGNEKVNKVIDKGNEAVDALKNTKAGKAVGAVNDKINTAKTRADELEKKLMESAKNTKAGKAINDASEKLNGVRDKAYQAGNKAMEAAKNSKIGRSVEAANETLGAVKGKAKDAATKAAGEVAAKTAAKAGATGAAEAVGMAIPYLNVAIVALEALKALKNIATKIKSKVTGKSEEELKQEKKKKRLIIFAIIFAFLFIEMSQFSMSETIVQDIDGLIERRERRYGNNSEFALKRKAADGSEENYKPLILFSADEYNDLVYGNYTDDPGYQKMLEDYGGELSSVLISKDVAINKENEYEVTAQSAKKYFQAEKDNFNKVQWFRFTNAAAYNYLSSNHNFESEEDMAQNDIPPFLLREGDTMADVETQKFATSELMVPNLNKYDVLPEGSTIQKGMVYVDMLSPYMQSWVAPFSILVDTQGDVNFAENVMSDMYNLARVYLYELYKDDKTTKRYYYLVIEQTYYFDIYEKVTCRGTTISDSKYGKTKSKKLKTTTNSKLHKPNTTQSRTYEQMKNDIVKDFGEDVFKNFVKLPNDYNETIDSGQPTEHVHSHSFYRKNIKIGYTLKKPIEIAVDSSDKPMIKYINVDRYLSKYKYIPKLKHMEDLYEIFDANYEIIPINEKEQAPIQSDTSELELYSSTDGIGLITLKERWQENFRILDSTSNDYKVSYLPEDKYESLGRKISRIEWKQDWGPLTGESEIPSEDSGGESGGGESGGESGGETGGGESGGGTGGGTVSADKQELFDWIVPLAKMIQKEYGILPSVTIAQKIQESGWKHTGTVLMDAHNFFGMKAGSKWTGPVVEVPTWEYENGVRYDIVARFRKYASDEEGFRGRGEFFWNNSSRYGGFINACVSKNWEAAVNQLISSGYATDPNYAEALKGHIRKYDLTQYDNDEAYTFSGTPPTPAPTPVEPTTPAEPTEPSEPSDPDTPGEEEEPVEIEITNENFLRRFEMFPEKTLEEMKKAYAKYSKQSYTYEDLYFAFYQMNKYYRKIPPNVGEAGSISVSASGFVWPAAITDSNPDTAIINALYGYTPVYGEEHTGIDISRGNVLYVENGVSKGAKVVAAVDGIVTHASSNPTSDSDGYTYVEIESGDGKYVTQYGHLSEIHVTVGQVVTKGTVIGVMGTTGNSTGVHLHFEVYEKTSTGKTRVDPLKFYNVTPTYGSINRNGINKLPSGYKYIPAPTPSGGSGGTPSASASALLEDAKKSWPDDLSETRKNIITQGAALVQVVPYVYGGGHGDFNAQLSKPTGLDCSAFVSYCHAKAGLNFGCLSSQAFKNNGNFKHISESELIPGDVGVNSHHVGIYIGKDSSGNKLWMHAQSTATGIVINRYKNFDTFVRHISL